MTLALLGQFHRNFPLYPLPEKIVGSAYSEEEYEEQLRYQGLRWDQLSKDLVEMTWDAFHLFSSEAFRYFLPGTFCLGLRENDAELLVFLGLVTQLDIKAGRDLSRHTRARWGGYTPPQYIALRAGFQWVFEEDSSFTEKERIAVFRTLDRLQLG